PVSDMSSDDLSYNTTVINGIEESGQSVNFDNIFSSFGTAVLSTYIMLTGDSASLSLWALRDNFVLIILMVAFSFLTMIYLLNLFIGILGKIINETNHEESFLIHKAKVLAEIEMFY
ncbi:33101_t:CDS:2, partial [Racocetra persica]